MDEIVGYVERITFQNEETGFTVAKLQEGGKKELTCIVGTLPQVVPGETVRCLGSWGRHMVHGAQFQVVECRPEAPVNEEGIKRYLGSGLIKGIGPKYAEKIVKAFGKETLNVINSSPQRLQEVAGLGKKRAEQIVACWTEQHSIRDVMIFLQSIGVSTSFAQKIFRYYGTESIKIIQENPYQLADDMLGVGFLTADRVAAKMGVEKESPKRIEAGIEYVLKALAMDGHTCFPLDLFLQEAGKMLEVKEESIQERLLHLTEMEKIRQGNLDERPFIWLKAFFIAEATITKELGRLRHAASPLRLIDTEKAIQWAEEKLHIRLADEQKKGVEGALTSKLHIITGGPGTGKSTITKVILAITGKLTHKILLAAPTGRAAKRMSEITGFRASTIHSLLEYDFRKQGFKKGKDDPLVCDLLIIDEASMIDTLLMASLLRAVPDGARVIFLGDIYQLPSVGAGNVLKDLIQSRKLSVTTLKEIFRQGSGSQIVTAAHQINQGIFPTLDNTPSGDFFFLECLEAEEALETILNLAVDRIPKKYHFDPLKDIQVLAPMRKGVVGIENLNSLLQKRLNPTAPPKEGQGRLFLKGDKVMQIRNNYEKEVYNGDVGIISHIDGEERELVIAFDEREVVYDFSEMDELMLAYAVSIHKYQGSECPCIIIPVHTSHFKMLNRNLLYTGVTRGKKLVILVGTKKALILAVKNDEVKERYTGLNKWVERK